MRVLIYSDVHGNLPAFEKILVKEGSFDAYISLGDLVNYGPWSNECVDLACSLPNSVLLMGNHEEAFINGVYPGINPLVQQFFSYTIANFNRFETIKSFINETSTGKYICRHTIGDVYVYPDTCIALDNNYFIGHSHHQFEYKSNGFTLYNAGSVGQNRKYIDVLNYLVYNTDTSHIQMKSLVYNLDSVIDEMKSRKYSEACLNYYLQKKRFRKE